MKIIVNGTFDILHRGHIELLEYAKGLGEFLLVCIDTDRRVKELKGENRPINNQADRAFMLQGLKCVDAVWTFDSEEDLERICEMYQPNIMVKGSDWKSNSGTAHQYSKEVIYYDRVGEYSTTNIIQRIADR